MELADLTAPKLIETALPGADSASVLRALARLLAASSRIDDVDELESRLRQREAIGSTGLGNGVAVPHCKMARLDQVVMAIGVTREPVAWKALDDQPVRLFFAVASPTDQPAAHLHCLAAISRWIKDPDTVSSLLHALSSKALYAMLPGADSGHRDSVHQDGVSRDSGDRDSSTRDSSTRDSSTRDGASRGVEVGAPTKDSA